MKMSPHPNIQEIAKAVEDAGADGLVMINSFGPCMAIDVESGLPLMGSKEGYGWLSGAAIKPLAVRCVYDAAKAVKIPIIGVGGITSGRDAAEMFMAGASAVQVCTAAILKGPDVYGRIVKELKEFLDSHGYADVAEIKGLTHRRMTEREAIPDDGRMCRRWIKNAAIFAGFAKQAACIRRYPRSGELVIDAGKCFRCGLCVTRCPKEALTLPGCHEDLQMEK